MSGWYIKHSGIKEPDNKSNRMKILESIMLDDMSSLKDFENAYKEYERLFGQKKLLEFAQKNNLVGFIYNDNSRNRKFLDSHLPSSVRTQKELAFAKSNGGEWAWHHRQNQMYK